MVLHFPFLLSFFKPAKVRLLCNQPPVSVQPSLSLETESFTGNFIPEWSGSSEPLKAGLCFAELQLSRTGR